VDRIQKQHIFQYHRITPSAIGHAGDVEEKAVPPNEHPEVVDSNHQQNALPSGKFRRRHIEPPPPIATKVGRKKLQDTTTAHHEKNTNNPKKEDGGAISKRTPDQQLVDAATSSISELGIELQHPYSDATPPPPSRRCPLKP
jgi:hypothetical protein